MFSLVNTLYKQNVNIANNFVIEARNIVVILISTSTYIYCDARIVILNYLGRNPLVPSRLYNFARSSDIGHA